MTNEDAVRDLIEAWARALETGDRQAIVAHHAPDFFMFDFPPRNIEGLEAYDRQWDFFYKDPTGPIRFTPRDIVVEAGDEVAFARCEIHCEGTSAGPLDLRLTVGLRKVDGAWTVVHEHHSVPTIENRLLPPA